MQKSIHKASAKGVGRAFEYVYWFRKCLRIHDNQGLALASEERNLLPIFIIDPYFWEKCDISENRLNFLLETMRDLDSNLRKMGSQLVVLRGSPLEVMGKLVA